jgi:rfaE bifunctional protein nucleotidyltransferase chain/domain
MERNGIFSNRSSKEQRIIHTLDQVSELVAHVKALGQRVVLTSGSYDMLHVGHLRYLELARNQGDFLIVGLDSDEKARKRKGEYRPVVPEDERAEVLCHSRSVDIIVIKQVGWDKHALIQTVSPDVLILVEGTYPQGVPQEITDCCGEVQVHQRQAETSTSAKIRRLLVGGMENFKKSFIQNVPELLEQCRKEALEKE